MTPTTSTEEKLAQTLQTSPIKQWFKELGLFAGIFASVFIISMVFINANMLYHTVRNAVVGVQAANYDSILTTKAIETDAVTNETKPLDSVTKSEEETILTDLVRNDHTLFINAAEKTSTALQYKDYDFSYSLIPPGNRIFISRIGVDAPIVDITAASEQKLKHGDFDKELYSGVVKYPSTPEPGHKGNTLIFGHTSFYRWKKNPYGEIFAKMFQLVAWDEIKVAWKWQMYTYEIVATAVVKPGEVDAEYMKYTDAEYITLMGCYPLGSDAKRWLIIAKRK